MHVFMHVKEENNKEHIKKKSVNQNSRYMGVSYINLTLNQK